MRRRLPLMLAAIALAATSGCGPGRVNASSSSGSGSGTDEGSGTEEGSESGDTSPSSGTTLSEDGSTETESETMTGFSFVPDDDVSSDSCSCDNFLQDCPAGEKCVPTIAGDFDYWHCSRCVPVLGDRQAGESCSYGGPVEGTDDCDEAGVCWNAQEVDGEWVGGECASFCGGTADQPDCPVGQSCWIAGNGSINLCMPPCHPLMDACEIGSCKLGGFTTYGVFTGYFCLISLAGAQAGEPCTSVQGCAAGLVCRGADELPSCDGPACCSPFCDLSLGMGQCDALPGTSCAPVTMEPVLGYEDVGVCEVLRT